MKRIFGVVFAVVFALLLVACGSDSKEPSVFGGPDPNFALPKADICGVWYASPENGGREITSTRTVPASLTGRPTIGRWILKQSRSCSCTTATVPT